MQNYVGIVPEESFFQLSTWMFLHSNLLAQRVFAFFYVSLLCFQLNTSTILTYNLEKWGGRLYSLDFIRLYSRVMSPEMLKATLTSPSVERLLFMFAASRNRSPLAPVALARSLPARSTRQILLVRELRQFHRPATSLHGHPPQTGMLNEKREPMRPRKPRQILLV